MGCLFNNKGFGCIKYYDSCRFEICLVNLLGKLFNYKW